MKFEATVKGAKLLERRISQIEKQKLAAAGDAIAEAAFLIQSKAVKSIQERGSNGGTVTRYNPKRTIKVSQPGNPPNSDRGTLAQSIGFEVNRGSLTARVGTSLKYGAWLEFGTQTYGARPWLHPAYVSSLKEISELLKKAMQ